jgi:hypothetical protein
LVNLRDKLLVELPKSQPLIFISSTLLATFQRVPFLSIVQQTDDDGQLTERAELDSGEHSLVGRDVWNGFSLLVPPGFPIVDSRWAIARWNRSQSAF